MDVFSASVKVWWTNFPSGRFYCGRFFPWTLFPKFFRGRWAPYGLMDCAPFAPPYLYPPPPLQSQCQSACCWCCLRAFVGHLLIEMLCRWATAFDAHAASAAADAAPAAPCLVIVLISWQTVCDNSDLLLCGAANYRRNVAVDVMNGSWRA